MMVGIYYSVGISHYYSSCLAVLKHEKHEQKSIQYLFNIIIQVDICV